MEIRAIGHKFGDNISTDDIIPARYLNTQDPGELAKHCMEGADPHFAERIFSSQGKGNCIIAGKNFGCGSSREHAPLAIKALGISCVIAESFARIFYRNAINIGLPIVQCRDAARIAESGDEILIDLDAGKITNLSKNRIYEGERFPQFIQKIIDAGGLMSYARKYYGNRAGR